MEQKEIHKQTIRNRAKMNNNFQSGYKLNEAISKAAKAKKIGNAAFIRMVIAKAIGFEGDTI